MLLHRAGSTASILVESEACDERIAQLQRDRFPFVLIGNPLNSDEILSVDNDNVLAGELATEHLIDGGLGGRIPRGRQGIRPVADDRITGYQRAIRGRQADHLIWHTGFGLRRGTSIGSEHSER